MLIVFCYVESYIGPNPVMDVHESLQLVLTAHIRPSSRPEIVVDINHRYCQLRVGLRFCSHICVQVLQTPPSCRDKLVDIVVIRTTGGSPFWEGVETRFLVLSCEAPDGSETRIYSILNHINCMASMRRSITIGIRSNVSVCARVDGRTRCRVNGRGG
jgi:hypothetical protein